MPSLIPPARHVVSYSRPDSTGVRLALDFITVYPRCIRRRVIVRWHISENRSRFPTTFSVGGSSLRSPRSSVLVHLASSVFRALCLCSLCLRLRAPSQARSCHRDARCSRQLRRRGRVVRREPGAKGSAFQRRTSASVSGRPNWHSFRSMIPLAVGTG
jgi:hypothetical protein